MLFKAADLDRIARGEVTLAFRRWRRPTVKAGGRLRTPVGVLRIGAVDRIEAAELTDHDARAAGFAGAAALENALAAHAGDAGALYRVRLDGVEADARRDLAAATPSDADWTALAARFERWERTAPGYFPRILAAVGAKPAVAAAILAAEAGVEKLRFKQDLRKLKELWLTESLETGYRLSPRGEAVLRRLEERR